MVSNLKKRARRQRHNNADKIDEQVDDEGQGEVEDERGHDEQVEDERGQDEQVEDERGQDEQVEDERGQDEQVEDEKSQDEQADDVGQGKQADGEDPVILDLNDGVLEDMTVMDISFNDPQLSFNRSFEIDRILHILDGDNDNEKDMQENEVLDSGESSSSVNLPEKFESSNQKLENSVEQRFKVGEFVKVSIPMGKKSKHFNAEILEINEEKQELCLK